LFSACGWNPGLGSPSKFCPFFSQFLYASSFSYLPCQSPGNQVFKGASLTSSCLSLSPSFFQPFFLPGRFLPIATFPYNFSGHSSFGVCLLLSGSLYLSSSPSLLILSPPPPFPWVLVVDSPFGSSQLTFFADSFFWFLERGALTCPSFDHFPATSGQLDRFFRLILFFLFFSLNLRLPEGAVWFV